MTKAPFATILAGIVAAFALVATIAWLGFGVPLPWHMPLSGFAMAGLLVASQRVSTFARIFIVMYAVGYLVLGGGVLLALVGVLGETLAQMLPPAFSATATTSTSCRCRPRRSISSSACSWPTRWW